MLNRRQLRGHTKSILCLSSAEGSSSSVGGEYSNVLVSGSEDCTARLWDVRTNRAQKCFTGCFGGNPVDSVCLHPSHGSQHLLHVGSGSDVFIFDLRKDGVLDRQPLAVVDVVPLEAESDINAISIHPKGHLLAAASDDGGVHLVDLAAVHRILGDLPSPPQLPLPRSLQSAPVAAAPLPPTRTGRLGLTADESEPAAIPTRPQPQPQSRITSATRRLSGGHENIASSVAFRPAPTSSDDVVSGGFDCKAILWEHSTGRRKSHALLGGQGGASGLGLNPPFVHALAYTGNGKYLLCGTGDGSVSVREAGGLGQVAAEEGHDSFTSCVHVPYDASLSGELAEAAAASTAAHETGTVAFSGGNDGKINAWRVRESTTTQPRKRRGKNKTANASGGGDASGGRRTQLVNLWALEHGCKINAVTSWAGGSVRGANQTCSESGEDDGDCDNKEEERVASSTSSASSSCHSFHLFVADTSKDLSVYTY